MRNAVGRSCWCISGRWDARRWQRAMPRRQPSSARPTPRSATVSFAQVLLSRTGLSASCDVGAGVDGLVIDASVVHVRRSLESEISAVVSELPAWSGGDGASAQKLAEFYNGDWAATRHVRCAISAVAYNKPPGSERCAVGVFAGTWCIRSCGRCCRSSTRRWGSRWLRRARICSGHPSAPCPE